jgi:hypothetical protein
MKALFVIPVLAMLLAVAGCQTGSKGKTVYATPEATSENELVVAPVVAPVEAQVVKIPTTARIDATSFLNALVLSGCEIDKAEYKEVTRGGGIIVTCTQRTGVLDSEGLGGL